MATINENNLIPVDATKLPEGHLAVRIGDYVHPIGISVPTGIDTNDATATAGQMLAGATAYVKGQKVTGTINDITITNDGSTITVPKGYNRTEQTFEVGGGTVELPEVTVSADKMLAGTTALDSNGNVITGSIQTVSLSRSGNTVSIGRGYTEGGSVTVPASGSTEAASYYACASVESGSWTGYAGILSENVLSFPGSAVSLNYSGNAPEIGNMYLADGSMKVIPNGEYVPIPFVSLAGGAAGESFDVGLEADTSNIYSEVIYTLDAPDGFSYSDGVISGTLPSTTGTFTMTLLAEADGYISVAARVDVTPVSVASGAPFIHFPFSESLASSTGQHLVQYSSAYNMPKLTTFDGRGCIWTGGEYGEYGTEFFAAKTFEYSGFTGSPTLTVSFFARPETDAEGSWYYYVPDCVCLGKSKSTGGLMRFSPLVRYDEDYNETNLIIGCDCWNFAVETDTGIKNDGKLHHYAFVLSGKQLSIYFDGNLLQTHTLSETVNLENSPVYFGRAAAGGFAPFNGYISDVKIWDRALSATEISALQ